MKSLAHFGEPTSGPTRSEIETEILSAISGRDSVVAAFGFGSFFRGERYNDIDLLIVSDARFDKLLVVYSSIDAALQEAGGRLKVKFDLTFFTTEEFSERPLLEMDTLVELWVRTKAV